MWNVPSSNDGPGVSCLEKVVTPIATALHRLTHPQVLAGVGFVFEIEHHGRHDPGGFHRRQGRFELQLVLGPVRESTGDRCCDYTVGCALVVPFECQHADHRFDEVLFARDAGLEVVVGFTPGRISILPDQFTVLRVLYEL